MRLRLDSWYGENKSTSPFRQKFNALKDEIRNMEGRVVVDGNFDF